MPLSVAGRVNTFPLFTAQALLRSLGPENGRLEEFNPVIQVSVPRGTLLSPESSCSLLDMRMGMQIRGVDFLENAFLF